MKQVLRSGLAILAVPVVGIAALLLASCSSAPDDISPAPVSQPRAPMETPVYRPPVQSPPAPAPQAEYKPMADDQCGAAALQYLVGKPRTDIPVPLNPGTRRVVCSSCIVTQEYRADRQTITFDSDTGLISSVKCG